MNGQELKNSILQLAIQGKLVEQREEDGTADELLEQIKVEKEKLIKEGKIKKEKKLPEIKKEELPFDIPRNWEWVRLRELGITQTGNTPSKTKKEYFGDYIPFISPGDILNGVINYQNQGLSEKGKEVGRVSGKYSILQVCIGGSIGKCAINLVDVSFNQQINAITPLICNHLYVYFLLDSKFFLLSMLSKATGTATPIINKTSWENLLFPLPPLEEQKRIVAKIQELMPYVEKYNKAYSEVEELNKKFPKDMQKSILQYAIQGKLVEQREEEGAAEELYQQIQEEKERLIKEGKIKKAKKLPEITEDEIPFDIPDCWKWVRLGDLCEKIGSGSTPKGGKSVYKESGIKFLRSQNIYNDGLRMEGIAYISEEQNKQGSVVRPRDILLNITGGSIGRCALVPDDFDVANINQHVMIIRNLVPENRFLLHYILISPYIQSMIMSVQVGVSREGLSAEKLKNFLIPFPPLGEQKRIVAMIEELLPYTKQLVN